MSQVTLNQTSTVSSLNNLAVYRSPQLAFAMLQMELAKANKDAAMQGIQDIRKQQALKKECSEYLNMAREYQNSKKKGDDCSDDFKKYCSARGISLPDSGDKDKNKTQWDKVIAQLQTHLDTLGSDIQTQMVQLQDMMGQYNSYMQGANSAIATSNQTLSSLARGQ